MVVSEQKITRNLPNIFKIEKKKLLLNTFPFLIITFCVFIDLINGLIVVLFGKGITIGIFYRGLLTIPLLIYLLKSRQNIRFYIFLLLIFFALCNIIWAINEQRYNFPFELKIFARHIYPILILNYLLIIKNRVNENFLFKLMVLYGTIASCSILFSFITGIGMETYIGESSFGIKSFFEGQNDTSLVLLFSLILSLYFYLHTKSLLFLLNSILITIGSFLLGTRAGMVISIFIWFVISSSLLIFKFRNSEIKTEFRIKIIFLSILFAGLAVILIVSIISKFDDMIKKFTIEALISGVEYSRSGLVQSGKKIISDGNFLELIFGHGYHELWYKNYVNLLQNFKGEYLVSWDSEKLRTIETDFVEVFGAYGSTLGIMILIIPIYFTILSVKNFIGNLSLKNYVFTVTMLMFLCHAYYAGHAIGSIMIGAPLAVIYFGVLIERKQQILKKITYEY